MSIYEECKEDYVWLERETKESDENLAMRYLKEEICKLEQNMKSIAYCNQLIELEKLDIINLQKAQDREYCLQLLAKEEQIIRDREIAIKLCNQRT